MSANKYGTILTIVLIVLIIAILVGLGFVGYTLIKPKAEQSNKKEAIEEFDRDIQIGGNNNDIQEDENTNIDIDTINPTETTQNPSTTNKKQIYKGFVMLGYIKIPKTNVNEPILDTVTPESLNTAVATLYPSNPQLNQPGNVVIIGHNYKNGQFFSNNKKLSVGDKFTIKDNTGTTLTYTIYEKFETTPEDASFYSRDTNGAIEVTLSTCTDDAKARIIILARAEQ